MQIPSPWVFRKSAIGWPGWADGPPLSAMTPRALMPPIAQCMPSSSPVGFASGTMRWP